MYKIIINRQIDVYKINVNYTFIIIYKHIKTRIKHI